jgi:cobalt-zinc-cadmium efflux system membrane fusion protein
MCEHRSVSGIEPCRTSLRLSMKRTIPVQAILYLALALLVTGCGRERPKTVEEGPPPANVIRESDANVFRVDHPDQFPLATAAEHKVAPELTVTGVVNPDISRNVPVISLASGRIVEIRARLGDSVKKGQLLIRVQSADISGAYSDYRKAVADERVARVQLDRSKLLYDKGAIAQKDLEAAVDAEEKARVDVENTQEHLRVLGARDSRPSGIVDIYAPVSGVITDQQVTAAGGVQALSGPNPFTISDLSHVWIVCDVYENQLSFVRLGEYADIRLAAYPDMALHGRIDNINPILDPNLRTAKVRLQVQNPGLMRVGMFVTATFHAKTQVSRAVVPANAVLHLHDREWVYVPWDKGTFRRIEVAGGAISADNTQEIRSGIASGQQVVANALELQNTVEQR